MKRVFVVDDDSNTREIVKKFLEREGYQVATFMNGENVLTEMHREAADCIVLDIMMPGVDGLALCREVRKTYDTPIIFVSAKGEELDRIIGLEMGADDYLVKPFSPRELVVRVKTVLRRVAGVNVSNTASVVVGNLVIDSSGRVVRINENEIALTNKEFDLLIYLAKSVNRALSREQLIDRVWGYDYVGDMRAVDDLVRRVRRKLKDVGANITIETVWGYGYKLEA